MLMFAISSCLAQAGKKPACPKITIIGPHQISEAGDTVTFVAEVSGNESNIKYEWAVDQGTIVEGQGTPAIFVTSRKRDSNIKATVRIDGLPLGCDNSATDMAVIAQPPPWCSTDSWGTMKPNDERARFDTFFVELLNNPTHFGLIILSVTAKEKLDPTNLRVKFVMHHARFRKFDTDRLIFGIELSDVRKITLFRVPPGAELPCDNCVIVRGRDLK